jgi:type IV pilus assembly protein PilQ
VVEVQPARKAAEAAADAAPVYKGEKLSLNFQDIETRAVLQLLADASGQNIVVNDTVTGNVTLRLQSVPWDQALDIVLRTKGLDKRQDGNVIIVAPAEELASRERPISGEKRPPGAGADSYRVSSGQLRQGFRHRGAAQGCATGSTNAVLSSRGSVAVDERTNTLLLSDVADRITAVRNPSRRSISRCGKSSRGAHRWSATTST